MEPMRKALVTGSAGFVGSNLTLRLRETGRWDVLEYDVQCEADLLDEYLCQADVVFHLAGVNRPVDPSEFTTGNADLTRTICEKLAVRSQRPVLILSSSTQAELDNAYGASKRQAELEVEKYGATAGASAVVFRLPNVFGKWARPNYNSAIATFCHNTARGLPIAINDPAAKLRLVYIDDVAAAMIAEAEAAVAEGCRSGCVQPVYETTVGEAAGMIAGFAASRTTLQLPDFRDGLVKKLYATYLSYLPADQFAYDLDQRSDHRGDLAEFMRGLVYGQVFVSRTKPGKVRGNHYHHTKCEKFFVLQGEAVIRFRHVLGDEVLDYPVRGEQFRVVDIPPGYTHSIVNAGDTDVVVLFWSTDPFDPANPDTTFVEVERG
ncbi:MAG: NAD-dependent epimerase/dehydratase family protein [Armatimonadetes bacterium]|nr:NAD-dependent epimerase/dehydratase family protein [Armatimonadota bacterium]